MKKEIYTIVHKTTQQHYDTNDQRFYSERWERTQDTKKYLEMLIDIDKEKFEGCEIITNN